MEGDGNLEILDTDMGPVLATLTLIILCCFRFYEELELEGVLKPMTSVIDGDSRQDDGTKHYVPPRGMSSLVKHFVNKSGKSYINRLMLT